MKATRRPDPEPCRDGQPTTQPRQCMAMHGPYTCLLPAGHGGPCASLLAQVRDRQAVRAWDGEVSRD